MDFHSINIRFTWTVNSGISINFKMEKRNILNSSTAENVKFAGNEVFASIMHK